MAQSSGAVGVALDNPWVLFPSFWFRGPDSAVQLCNPIPPMLATKILIATNLEQSPGRALRMRIVFCWLRASGRNHQVE